MIRVEPTNLENDAWLVAPADGEAEPATNEAILEEKGSKTGEHTQKCKAETPATETDERKRACKRHA